MAIKYNKEIVKPDGRRLITGGPRDQQKRLQATKEQESLIDALKDEIMQLRDNGVAAAVASQPVVTKDMFTGEQVDNEIRQAVTGALSKKEKELEKERIEKTKLTAEISALKNIIIEKDKNLKLENERVTQLMAQLSASNKEGVIHEDPDRPKMERTFIDPLESDSDEHLVPHLESEEIETKKQDKIYSSVDKLRGLVGKLPNNNN